MRYINWILRVAVFIALLGFAVKNDQQVTLYYYFGYEWQASLVMILLIFFAAGTIAGMLSMVVKVLKQRREISRLKRDLKAINQLPETSGSQQSSAHSS